MLLETRFSHPALEAFAPAEDASPAITLHRSQIEACAVLFPPEFESRALEFAELGFAVSNALLPMGLCLFHGTAFLWRGKAWIFAAPSGTGKTTQYALWKLRYEDELHILNGDKPILDGRDHDALWVRPSPWCGKERMSRMEAAPLGGIILLQQSKENSIERLDVCSALEALYLQFLYSPENEARVSQVCALEERLLREVPIWRLRNRGDIASAVLTHDTIARYEEETREV